MIVDLRVRPPFGGYLETGIYKDRQRTMGMIKAQGYTPSKSLVDASFDAFLAELKESGIDVCVVPGRYTTPAYGQVPNDDLAELSRRYPGKFLCFAAVNANAPDAAEKLEEAVRDLGLAGLNLDAGFHDPPQYVDDQVFKPLYERCSDLQVPILITYSGHAGPDIGYADPVRLDRVAAAFPKLPIVVVHAAWPWIPQIFGVAFRRPNVYLSPDMYMVNMPGSGLYVEAANGVLQDRIFFGSGYPFLPLKEAVAYYENLPLTPAASRAVMGNNAARLFKLS